MTFYFAPLEGLSGAVYRRAHATVFGGADRYFTPFYSPTTAGLCKRDMQELDGEDRNTTVPQLLTRRAPDMLAAAAQLYTLGYRTLNLNFGCPSGTVTAKHKGAGFLLDLAGMVEFFEAVFARLPDLVPGMTVSVKTRIGYALAEEFCDVLAVYNRYPLSELIIHPRTRQEFYRGQVHLGAYAYARENTTIPLCYNGDIFSAAQYGAILHEFPETDRIMIGRGAVADPALFLTLRGAVLSDKEKLSRMREMHDLILEENARRMGSGRNLLCRMADIWNYQIHLFDGAEDAFRRIRHAANLTEYKAGVATLFRECPLRPDGCFCPTNK